MISPKTILLVIVVIVWAGFSSISWRSAIKLKKEYPSAEYRYYCPPGLYETVETIRNQGVAEVYGPDPDCWSYAHQRLSELLYPIEYKTPLNLADLDSGTLFVLFANQPVPAQSKELMNVGQFRVMKVSP